MEEYIMTTNQQSKVMTTKEAIETFASFEQAQKYGLAYVHIFNVARAYAKKKRNTFSNVAKKVSKTWL